MTHVRDEKRNIDFGLKRNAGRLCCGQSVVAANEYVGSVLSARVANVD